ncbi:twin-arginine translocase subunit TatC [Kangiella taiwanensis]|uniref:Sec-independent protein translocase protein TatC n=1 Tax=Kangiella taiwanensis TaxID=1079179 RepID=A0ABP8HUF2_9GAMM|nr:twin-arginine translocase subunit TatC [Kangiella taiwanensis]
MSESNSNEMPLLSHLIELRSRLLRSVLVIIVIFIGLAFFANELYEWLSRPLKETLPENSTLIAIDVTAPLFAPFKLAFVMAIFIAMPFVLHQAWLFISPGLYKHEKGFAVPLLVSSVILFYAGIAFAYFVIFPIIFSFLSGIGPQDVNYLPDINSVLSIALKLFFAFGLAFEIPIATMLLIWSGLVSHEKLSNTRPYMVVGMFVFAMLLTPPDLISQVLLAIPMWILFELGLIFARAYSPKKAKDQDDQS